MEVWGVVALIGIIIFFFNIKKNKEIRILEEKNEKNAKLIEAKAKLKDKENTRRFLDKLLENVDQNLHQQKDIKGHKYIRRWFANMCSEVNTLVDDFRAEALEFKKRPSLKGADQVREISAEKRKLMKELKYLEYQLKTYEDYFPIIEEIKDYILEDDSFLFNLGDKDLKDEVDPSQKFLSPQEFKKLPIDKKNQLALDRYLKKKHSKLEIGRFYERYLGYKYEMDGWVVKFTGIIEGFDDLGRDLICTKGNTIEIVQAKNWSKFKTIREKYLYQHFATTTHFKLQNKLDKKIKVVPVFYYTNAEISDMAKKVAKALHIRLDTLKIKKDYPMIKCNINPQTKEKIYHLPFDQQYDKIIIGNNSGEFYASTVKEAVKKGFRRAFRYRGPA
tara:strand:+ start:94 stop:1260 length:1167 start_codon:yes stop_codon:yes gene_type:complete